MAEYGIASPEQITWGWTPAQVFVAFESIRRRRLLEQVEKIENTHLAMTAAQGGKKGFKALRHYLRRLRHEAGVTIRGATAQDLVQAMGLSMPHWTHSGSSGQVGSGPAAASSADSKSAPPGTDT
jgi:hypothetical protein